MFKIFHMVVNLILVVIQKVFESFKSTTIFGALFEKIWAFTKLFCAAKNKYLIIGSMAIVDQTIKIFWVDGKF